jgi:hypothetical protein
LFKDPFYEILIALIITFALILKKVTPLSHHFDDIIFFKTILIQRFFSGNLSNKLNSFVSKKNSSKPEIKGKNWWSVHDWIFGSLILRDCEKEQCSENIHYPKK